MSDHYYLYLDTRTNEFVVDAQTYEEIMTLVQTAKLCSHNYQVHEYTLDNPCVGRNICLQHLLEKQHDLTVVDSFTYERGQHWYRYTDRRGYIYTSTEDSSHEASKDMMQTLVYYGFVPPTTIEVRGKSVDFHTYYATLHGDLKTASVIVLSYNHASERVKGLFLLYKNGEAKELSKKSDVYHRADELVEQSKDAQGTYRINGYTHYGKFEADVYEVISQLESATYEVTLKLKNDNHKGDA